MTEQEITQILLVRAVEERGSDYLTPANQLEALIAAGAEENDTALIQTRARSLFERLPDTVKHIPQTLRLSRTWILLLCAGAFLLGIGFNYLGPGEKIHVIYNPAVLLIVWNIGIFAVFLTRHLFLKKKTGGPDVARSDAGQLPAGQSAGQRVMPSEPPKPGYTSSVSHWLFRKIWFALHKEISKKTHDLKVTASSLRIYHRFMELWWGMNQEVFIARFTRAIHILAVFLIAGALAGIYMRGLFFEYNVIWKSTFIHDRGDIALILNLFFGLPSRLLYGTFIEASVADILLSPAGDPAAPWIHLFAVSAAVFVVPGRIFLALLESARIRSRTRQRTINPADSYYARCILLAQEMQANRLRDEIKPVVHQAIDTLAGSIAAYVRDSFYDTRVVPKFINFRENGGRIRNLETEIARESEQFADALDSFLEKARDDFRKSVSEGVSGIVRKKLAALEVDTGSDIEVTSDAYREAFNETITNRMTDGISLAVTAAVAASVGTLSGGFGKVVGIAVISTLLHTTGPVGFVIGALAGLLLGGGAAVLARDRITDAVKNQNFPAFSTRMLLRESKLDRMIDQGKSQVYRMIRTEIEGKMAPRADEITKKILSGIAVHSNPVQ